MGSTDDSPNADVIVGLREVADFLEAHPELPRLSGFVHGHVYGKSAREVLGRTAETLGEDATESVRYGDVVIGREFSGGVDIEVHALAKDLGGRKAEVDYEPILSRETVGVGGAR